ncbi:MAG TPA: hypothetical protein VJ837_02400 [Candidatus Paceibacterota bacterium]|nr:hypothetical protein [Candidatus Paceibacterota bacterium]
MTKDDLQAEFRDRVIHEGGVELLAVDDALALISRASEERLPVLGVDGFFVSDGSVQSPLEHLADFSSAVERGDGCWTDAAQFVEERRPLGLVFEVVLGGATPSNPPLQTDGRVGRFAPSRARR